MKIIVTSLAAFLFVFSVLAPTVTAAPAEVKLLASDGGQGDYFGGVSGNGLAISGDYAVVGANGAGPSGTMSGAVYIFHNDGGGWHEQQKLTASDGDTSDNFGYSVAVSDNNVIVGAHYGDGNVIDSGTAYIYHFDGSRWVERQKLVASDGAVFDRFGQYVSISGDYAIVGAPAATTGIPLTGAAYIYHYNGTSWVEAQKLMATDRAMSDNFGNMVSISGDHAIIGAQLDNDNGFASGSAYIFHYDGTNWLEQQKLLASDGDAEDRFGSAVSISGHYAIVGAFLGNGLVADSGSAYIFHFDGVNWVEQQKLRAYDGLLNDRFGNSVSISGANVIVNGNVSNGAAYVYHYDGNVWRAAEKLVASDVASADWFGDSVAISGNMAIVGASADDDNGEMSGSAYLYIYTDPALFGPD